MSKRLDRSELISSHRNVTLQQLSLTTLTGLRFCIQESLLFRGDWNHANVRNTMWLVNTPSKHKTLTQF